MIFTKLISASLVLRKLSTTLANKPASVEVKDIPLNLASIPVQSDPVFSDMIKYNFHKARVIIEGKIIESLLKDSPNMDVTVATKKVESIMKYIEKPDCVIKFTTPFQKDDGTNEILSCYKVQHIGHRLPFIGGLRYSKSVTRDQMIALAMIISFSCACAGISHGGSKSGIAIDPKTFTPHELERITRSFTHKLVYTGTIGPSIDVISPDVGTGEKEMTWIGDSYRKAFGNIRNVGSKGVVTGRTRDQGGIFQDINPTAVGVFYCLQTIFQNNSVMKDLKLNPGLEGKTFILQGFGKVGAAAGKLLCEAGAKCIGIQGFENGLINTDGIDTARLYEYKLKHGTITNYKYALTYTGDFLLGEPCDILILAATEKCIRRDCAQNINAKIVIEASSGPITPAAEITLLDKNVLILPDILACMGSVIMSHIELLHDLETYTLGRFTFRFKGDRYIRFLRSVQDSLNRQKDLGIEELYVTPNSKLMLRVASSREETIIQSSLEGVVQSCTEQTINTAKEFNLGKDFRTAGYINGIRKIFFDINDVMFSW